MYYFQKHDDGFAVACADFSELLKPAKETFHNVTSLMLSLVLLPEVFAIALWRNTRSTPCGSGHSAGFIAFVHSIHQAWNTHKGFTGFGY